jgi:predicted ATP-binding protein involved in virulence
MLQSRQGENVVFPAFAYHGTGRLWAEHEKVGFQKQEEGIKMAYNNCLSAKSSSREFLEWYKTQEDSIAKFDQPSDKAQLTAFKTTILSLIPDKRWQDMAFDRKQEELVGVFTDAAGQKHKLAFRQLSDGFRNIIGLAADIAYRCIQLNPHLGEKAVAETPGIVLIDELDLHLHPNWQRHVVADLKRAFPNIQFVATTHSPFIVQSLDASELINLDRISDINPSSLTIDEVSTQVMGVEDVRGTENFEQEKLSKSYLNLLENPDQVELNEIENQISDPAVRAFLQMQRLKQEINP